MCKYEPTLPWGTLETQDMRFLQSKFTPMNMQLVHLLFVKHRIWSPLREK